jgi:hypothetical protein
VFRNKGTNLALKKKILPSLFKEEEEGGAGEDKVESLALSKSAKVCVDFDSFSVILVLILTAPLVPVFSNR